MDGDASDAGTSAGPTTPHAQQQEQPLTPPRRSPPVASAEDNFTLLVSPSRKKRTKTKSRTPSASMTPRVKIRVPKHLLMAVPTMALVSDADYADFFEGESAVSTSSRIAELGQAGKTYASFRALMEDVRQQQLRASFRDQVQRAMGEDVVVMRAAYMEQVSASVNSEESERFEMRHKILFYLSSPTCPLFQDGFNFSPEARQQVERLINEDEWNAVTFAQLKRFEAREEQFSSLEDLIETIQDAEELESCHRKLVHVFLKKGDLGGLHADNYDADMHPSHRLFAGQPAPVEATTQAIDKLFNEGEAGPSTINHLKALDRSGARFPDTDSLIEAVKLMHWEEVDERNKVKEFLSSSRMLDAYTRVTPGDVDLLFEEGRAGLNTLPHIRSLYAGGTKYDSWDALIEGVQDKHAVLLAHIDEAHKFLLDTTKQNLLTPEAASGGLKLWQTDRLFVDTRAGLSTIVHLNALERSNNTFDTIGSLTEAVREQHDQDLANRAAVFSFLADPQAHALLPMDEVEVTPYEVDRLFDECRCGAATLSHLKSLEGGGYALESWEDLRGRLKKEHEASLVERAEVHSYLLNTEHALLPAEVSSRLTLGAVDSVFDSALSARRTLRVLEDLETKENTYSSLDELTAAVKHAHEQQQLNQYAVLSYLCDPSRQSLLVPEEVVVVAEDVDRLFDEVRAGPATLGLLVELNDTNQTFESFDALIDAVGAKQAKALDDRERVLRWLSNDANHDLLDVSGTPCPVRLAEVNKIFDEVGSGPSTLGLLQDLDASNTTSFAGLTELIDALIDAQAMNLTRRVQVLEYLREPRRHLLLNVGDTAYVSARDVDRLFDDTKAGASTPARLLELDLDSTDPYSSMEELVDVVRAMVGEDQRKQDEIFTFLTDRRQATLLEKEAAVRRKDVAGLFHEAYAGGWQHTLDVLRELNADSAEGEFESIADVADAVLVESNAMHRRRVQAYLEHGDHGLLPMRHAPRAIITPGAVDRLFSTAGAGPATERLLRTLDLQGRSYGSMAEVTDAAAKLRLDQREVLAYLRDPFAHALLADDDVETVTEGRVEALFETARSAACTLDYLLALDHAGAEHVSFQDLVNAVTAMQQESLRQRAAVRYYLTDEPIQHALLTPEALQDVDMQMVDTLFEKAGASGAIMEHLLHLDQQKNPFTTTAALIDAVRARRMMQAEFERAVLGAIAASENEAAYGDMLARDGVAALDRLFQDPDVGANSGIALQALLTHLEELPRKGAQVDSVDDLLALLKRMRKRARIMNYLNADDTHLLLTSLMKDCTEDEVDDLLNACHEQAPEQVLAKCKALDREGTRFNDISELTLELSRTERLKDSLFAYLNGFVDARQADRAASQQPHRLFQDDSELVKGEFSAEDVDYVYAEGAGLSSLACAQALDRWGGNQYGTLPELARAVREQYEASLGLRKEVLGYLQDTEGHSLLPPIVAKGIRERDVDHLVDEGEGGLQTLARLQLLDEEQRSFPTVETLAEALREQHEASLQTKQDVWKYLTKQSDEGRGHSLLPAGAEEDIGLHDVDMLFSRGQAGGRTKAVLKALDTEGQRFKTPEQLRTSFVQWADADLDNRAETTAYLSDPSNHSLLPTEHTPVSRAQVDTLYDIGGAGHSTPWLLRELNAKGRRFNDMEDLTNGLGDAFEASLQQRGDTLRFLRNPDGHNLLPKQVAATVDKRHVTALYDRTGAGSKMLPILRELDATEPPYMDMETLVDGVAKLAMEEAKLREETLVYLLHTDEHGLLGAPPAFPVNRALVDSIFENGQAGLQTLMLLRGLSQYGHSYRTPEQLVRAVSVALANFLETRSALIGYITAGDHSLLPGDQAAAFGRAEADRVFAEALSGSDTVELAIELNRRELRCETLDELIAAIRMLSCLLLEEKTRVLAYLRDQDQHGLLDVSEYPISRKEVGRLFDEGRAGASTFPHLRALNALERAYFSVEELIAAVQEHTRFDRQERAKAREWLRSGPPAHLLLPEEVCGSITVGEVDDLFLACGAGGLTLQLLMQLNAENMRCGSMPALVRAVCEAYDGVEDDKATALSVLRDPNAHAMLPERSCRRVKREDVDRLFAAADNSARTLSLLRDLIRRELQFSSVDGVVEAMVDAHRAAKQDIESLLLYLGDQRNHSLLYLRAIDFDRKDAETVYDEGGAGRSTEWLLDSLDEQKIRFPSLEALVEALREAHAQSLGQRAEVLAYLHDRSAQQLLPASLHVRVNDVDRLYDEGLAGKHTLKHLQVLQSNGSSFEGITALVQGLKLQHELFVHHKAVVLSYLRDASQHDLLHRQQCEALTAVDIDALFYAGQTELRSLALLKAIDDFEGAPMDSVQELADTLMKANQDRVALRAYLKDTPAQHELLPAKMCEVARLVDVDSLFAETRTGWRTQAYLRELAAIDQRFQTWSELADGVSALHLKDLEERAACLAYLKDAHGHQLLSPQYADQILDARHVDRTFDRSGVPKYSVMLLLRQLSRTQHEYEDMLQVDAALRNVWRKDATYRVQVQRYLESQEHKALLPRALVSKQQVDRLFDATSGGSAVLAHLKTLDGQGRVFTKEEDLVRAVTDMHASSLRDRDAVFEYLSDPAMHRLLPLQEILGHLTLSEIDRLFDEGGAGPRTLAYLKALDYERRQFADMDNLIDSVGELDSESVAHQSRHASPQKARDQDAVEQEAQQLEAQRKRIKELEEALRKKNAADRVAAR